MSKVPSKERDAIIADMEDHKGGPRLGRRIHIVYLSKVRGMSEEEIACDLSEKLNEVKRCLKRYEQEDLDGLRKKPENTGLRVPEPDEVEYWVEEAERDMRMAYKAYEEREYRLAAFLTNMSLEKHVKAFLLKCGVIRDPRDIGHIELHEIMNMARNTGVSDRMKEMFKGTVRMLRDPEAEILEYKDIFGIGFDPCEKEVYGRKIAERNRLQMMSETMDDSDVSRIEIPLDGPQKEEFQRAVKEGGRSRGRDFELKFCLEGYVPGSDDARRADWATYLAVRKLHEMKILIYRSRHHREMSQFPMQIGYAYSTEMYKYRPDATKEYMMNVEMGIRTLKRAMATIPEWWNNGKARK